MRPFDPYVDDSGKRWFDPSSAARISHTVSDRVWGKWAAAGETTFGLRLETSSIPLMRTSYSRPRSDRQFRLVIAENSVMAVRQIFDEVFGDNRAARKNYTGKEWAQLDTATRRHYYRAGQRLASLAS
jgi:hypothetical protein